MEYNRQNLLNFPVDEILSTLGCPRPVNNDVDARSVTGEIPAWNSRIRKSGSRKKKANKEECCAEVVENYQVSDFSSATTPSHLESVYDPSRKGDATWDRDVLYTFDGWAIFGGPVESYRYPSVKGIDLVRWFTENYVADQAELNESRQRSLKNFSKAPRRLGTWVAPSTVKNSRKHKRRHKYRSAFLNLPAEIRNHIYSYIVPPARILIQRNRPGKVYNMGKSVWRDESEPVYRPPNRLSHLLDNDDEEDGLTVSPALLFTCRKIKDEIQLFMYAQYIFCFDSMKVVRKFLNKASPEGLRVIKKLELHFPGYAPPKLTKHADLKKRHDRNWLQLSRRIAEELPSVQSLRLQIDIQDWPLTMHSSDGWFKIAMHLTDNRRIDDVRVRLAHKMMGAGRLARAARRLEEGMMNDEGIRARDERAANLEIRRYYEAEAKARAAREERKKILPPVQATRVLNIVLDEDRNDDESQPEKKERKYYNSKTEQYAREYLYGEYPDSYSY